MIKSVRTVTAITALLFSMGAMAQSGGAGNPTQNMGKDNPNMAQPGGSSEPDASMSHKTTTKHKATHKKSSDKSTVGKTSDGTPDGPGK
jgi:hypothetical protein